MLAQILIVMIAAIAVSVVAERRGVQPPLLLASVGLIASFIPGLDRLELEPEIILTVVLPPLLFSVASDFSFVSFVRRLGSIANLGVLLVIVTAEVVGGIAASLIPGMTLAAALVLGAVVSPPDAITATAVGRQLGLPLRMMTVLKGESLINDAAALTLFTFATATVAGTDLLIDNFLLYLAYSAVAGIVIGLLIGRAVHWIRVRVTSPTLSTVATVLVPFAAFLVAEELHASGVMAVVMAGFSLGSSARDSTFAARIQERQFWRTVDGVLEAFVFAYIGLQLRFVIEDVERSGLPLWELFGIAFIVFLAVIAVRLAWVFVTARIARSRYRAWQRGGRRGKGGRDPLPPFTWRENLVIAWSGMRGVVTLAAAAGIPLTTASGLPFPGRDVAQAIAFVVTIGTLLLHGLTLPWLIRRLGISAGDEASYHEAQRTLAEQVARDAMRVHLGGIRDRTTDPATRSAAEGMLRRLGTQPAPAAPAPDDDQLIALSRQLLTTRRAAVIKARDDRRLDDEVMREVLEQMDLEQAMLAGWTPGRFGRGG